MKYTKEELFNMPVSRLVDMILEMQDRVYNVDLLLSSVKRAYKTLENIVEHSDNEEVEIKRPGRKPHTPEQKALAYERQKARQREAYQIKKNSPNED